MLVILVRFGDMNLVSNHKPETKGNGHSTFQFIIGNWGVHSEKGMPSAILLVMW